MDLEFSPEKFKRILQERMDPAVKHFKENATKFARLSNSDARLFVGADPENLAQDTAQAWNGCVANIVQGRQHMVQLLQELSDMLYEVLDAYQESDGKSAQHFHSIANN